MYLCLYTHLWYHHWHLHILLHLSNLYLLLDDYFGHFNLHYLVLLLHPEHFLDYLYLFRRSLYHLLNSNYLLNYLWYHHQLLLYLHHRHNLLYNLTHHLHTGLNVGYYLRCLLITYNLNNLLNNGRHLHNPFPFNNLLDNFLHHHLNRLGDLLRGLHVSDYFLDHFNLLQFLLHHYLLLGYKHRLLHLHNLLH